MTLIPAIWLGWSHSHSNSKGEWECLNSLKPNPHSPVSFKFYADSDHELNMLGDMTIPIHLDYNPNSNSSRKPNTSLVFNILLNASELIS